MKKLLLLLIVLLVIGVIYWWRLPHTVQGPSSKHAFEYIIRITGNGGSSDTLPLLIALHGHGDTAENFFDTLLKDFNSPARFILMRGPIDYPGVSLSGRAWPTDIGGLQEYGDALADAISVLEEDFPTEGRPIILGFSSGAYLAYYIAAFHADQFSYIFPLSGKLPGELMTTEMISFSKGAKVIAFHGTKDQVVGFYNGKVAVENLRQRGLTAELVTFNGGHIGVFLSANNLFLNHLGNAVNEIVP